MALFFFFEQETLHFHFAQGPANQVASPAPGSAAIQRAGEGKLALLQALFQYPQREWHLHSMVLKAPKLKLRGT